MGEHRRKPSLLIVDDEVNFQESLEIALDDVFSVSLANSLTEARGHMKVRVPDAILLDVRLPDGDGVEFLRDIKSYQNMPVVFVMTAFATIENAVSVLKEGAVDYLIKPFDIEKLKRELSIYLENRSLHERIDTLDRELKKIIPPFITSGTGKMKVIVDRAPIIAPLDIPILISGDTGTGKERLAKWIHTLSNQKGDMVVINCASLPKDILESEMFGYVKGAFSGAAASKEGIVEKADGGTLFLDEIGALPEDIQAKFLRVLEEGVYYKLGDPKERRISFRLISATNSHLADPSSSFRRDLFYRISGIIFELPPLRERRDDIPLLVSAFIQVANYTYKKNVKGVSPKIMQLLTSHDWPGNIRELKWFIHRAVAVSTRDIIERDEIIFEINTERVASPEGNIDYLIPFRKAIEDLEKKYITHALEKTANNKTEAAKMLGISVRALHYKLKIYHL
jgi:DNA-binding NtrC family response regulator